MRGPSSAGIANATRGTAGRGDVRAIHDCRIGRAVLDRGKREPDARRRDELRLEASPRGRASRDTPRVDPGRHGGRVANGDAANGGLRPGRGPTQRGAAGRLGTAIASWFATRSTRARRRRGRPRTTSICASSALMNRSTRAPAEDLPRQRVRGAEVERRGGLRPAAAYACAIRSMASVEARPRRTPHLAALRRQARRRRPAGRASVSRTRAVTCVI